MIEIYPWQRQQWRQLGERRAQGRLPHALLLTGLPGLGKADFARQLAQGLLCEAPEEQLIPCGHCRSCTQVIAGSHPDLNEVIPAEGKKNISVDQVREVAGFLSLTAQYSGNKVVLLMPAEAMNVNAANSLLKTLEEPSGHSHLILVANRPAQLPATIRSRCQEIRFGRADEKAAGQWLREKLGEESRNWQDLLAIADGSPLRALEMADKELARQRQDLLDGLEQVAARQLNPIMLAHQWVSGDMQKSLYWIHSWITDMIRLKAATRPPHINNQDILSRLQQLAAGVSLEQLFHQLQRVSDALRQLDRNANAQLVLEDVFIRWEHCFKRAKRVV